MNSRYKQSYNLCLIAENMKINMSHNKSIKFDDIVHHLELKDEWFEAIGISHQTYLVENSKFVPSFKKKIDFHVNKFKGKKNYNDKPKYDGKMNRRKKHE